MAPVPTGPRQPVDEEDWDLPGGMVENNEAPRANIITPGLIRVASLENLLREAAPQFGWGESWQELEQGALRDLLPNDVGSLGLPEDVAVVVALLASPLSRYVTGANWRIDGGATMGI